MIQETLSRTTISLHHTALCGLLPSLLARRSATLRLPGLGQRRRVHQLGLTQRTLHLGICEDPLVVRQDVREPLLPRLVEESVVAVTQCGRESDIREGKLVRDEVLASRHRLVDTAEAALEHVEDAFRELQRVTLVCGKRARG